jgi:hypothetical protein
MLTKARDKERTKEAFPSRELSSDGGVVVKRAIVVGASSGSGFWLFLQIILWRVPRWGIVSRCAASRVSTISRCSSLGIIRTGVTFDGGMTSGNANSTVASHHRCGRKADGNISVVVE